MGASGSRKHPQASPSLVPQPCYRTFSLFTARASFVLAGCQSPESGLALLPMDLVLYLLQHFAVTPRMLLQHFVDATNRVLSEQKEKLYVLRMELNGANALLEDWELNEDENYGNNLNATDKLHLRFKMSFANARNSMDDYTTLPNLIDRFVYHTRKSRSRSMLRLSLFYFQCNSNFLAQGIIQAVSNYFESLDAIQHNPFSRDQLMAFYDRLLEFW
jgi:hypothetical protein